MGAERVDVGIGAQAAAIFRRPGTAREPGPVVIFLHGWVAIDPQRYGPWIGHLVRGGATVIYPAYQTKPAYDTITPLANVLAGVRAALEHVALAPGRLVVAGHSAGGALAADYAAVAAANGLPAPAAVFSVYPGRKLRHLAVPIPAADLGLDRPGHARARVRGRARHRGRAAPRPTRIVAGAVHADATLRIIRDDAVDEHSAPRRFDGAAQRTFWEPLDALVAATARVGRSGRRLTAGGDAARPSAGAAGRRRRRCIVRSTDWPVSQGKGATSVDLNDTPEQVQYRAKVRAWLDEHKARGARRAGRGRRGLHRTPAAPGRASSRRPGWRG